MPQKRMECFRLLLEHLLSPQLAKGLGLGILCWGFKGVQGDIPSEEASTLQSGSVAFPPGQCTSPQLHPCHRLFNYLMGIKTVPHPPYISTLASCDFWLFPKLTGCRYETIEEMKLIEGTMYLSLRDGIYTYFNRIFVWVLYPCNENRKRKTE